MRHRNGHWIDNQGFIVEAAPQVEHRAHRREIAARILAAMASAPGFTVDIDGPHIGAQRASIAVALADALLAELEKE